MKTENTTVHVLNRGRVSLTSSDCFLSALGLTTPDVFDADDAERIGRELIRAAEASRRRECDLIGIATIEPGEDQL